MIHDDSLTQEEQFDLLNEMIAFWKFYPDIFLESITPHDEEGNRQGITLGSDQKMILRALCRFEYTHIVLPRGFG